MNGSQHDFVGAAFVRAQIAAAKREGCRPHGVIVSRGLPRSNAVRAFLQKSKVMAPQASGWLQTSSVLFAFTDDANR